MTESRSAQNMRAVVKAKDHHNRTCRYKGTALEVHLHPTSLQYIGWDDGDTIAGLLVVSDLKQRPGSMRIYCDVELNGAGGGDGEVVQNPVHTFAGAPA